MSKRRDGDGDARVPYGCDSDLLAALRLGVDTTEIANWLYVGIVEGGTLSWLYGAPDRFYVTRDIYSHTVDELRQRFAERATELRVTAEASRVVSDLWRVRL